MMRKWSLKIVLAGAGVVGLAAHADVARAPAAPAHPAGHEGSEIRSRHDDAEG